MKDEELVARCFKDGKAIDITRDMMLEMIEIDACTLINLLVLCMAVLRSERFKSPLSLEVEEHMVDNSFNTMVPIARRLGLKHEMLNEIKNMIADQVDRDDFVPQLFFPKLLAADAKLGEEQKKKSEEN